jgi:hypothetical protein
MPIKKLDRPVAFGKSAILVDVAAALNRLAAYPSEYLGTAELSAIAGFKPGTVWARRCREITYLPKPVVELKAGPVYLKSTVKQWIEDQRRNPIVQEPAKPE